MTLLDSLLDAIIRLEGDALIMHVGERPYVLTTSNSSGSFRGPLSWGQVELSSRALTGEAVMTMVRQMLPPAQLQVFEEIGAVEHEIGAPGESPQRFLVVAARGGEDLWVEVRKKPEPVPVAAEEPAAEAPVASGSEAEWTAMPGMTPAVAGADVARPEPEPVVGQAGAQPVDVGTVAQGEELAPAAEAATPGLMDSAVLDGTSGLEVVLELDEAGEEPAEDWFTLDLTAEKRAELPAMTPAETQGEASQPEAAADAVAHEAAGAVASDDTGAMAAQEETRAPIAQDAAAAVAADESPRAMGAEESARGVAAEEPAVAHVVDDASAGALAADVANALAAQEALHASNEAHSELEARRAALAEAEARLATREAALAEEAAAVAAAQQHALAAEAATALAAKEAEATTALAVKEAEEQAAARVAEEQAAARAARERASEAEAALEARRAALAEAEGKAAEAVAALAAKEQALAEREASLAAETEARLAAREAALAEAAAAALAAREQALAAEAATALAAKEAEAAARVEEEQAAARAAREQTSEAEAALEARRAALAEAEARAADAAAALGAKEQALAEREASLVAEAEARIAAREEALAAAARAVEEQAAARAAEEQAAARAAREQTSDAETALEQRRAALAEAEARATEAAAALAAKEQALAEREASLMAEAEARLAAREAAIADEAAAALAAQQQALAAEAATALAAKEVEAAAALAAREEALAAQAARELAAREEALAAREHALAAQQALAAEAVAFLASQQHALASETPAAEAALGAEATDAHAAKAAASRDARAVMRLHPKDYPVGHGSSEGVVPVLQDALERGASTVYAVAGARPMLRIEGEIAAAVHAPLLGSADIDRFAFEFAPRDEVAAAPTEWMCSVPGVGRVRCVSFEDESGRGLVFQLAANITSADELGLSREVQALCREADGLVVIAGPRGSGKSSLLGAFVDLINRTRADHIITIESRVRTLHERRHALISQREVDGDGDAVARAVRAALREGPDVLVVDDVRSPEAIAVALDAARAGRLVFASIPAPNSTVAIQRLIDAFAVDRRPQVRALLAGALRAVISQVLVQAIAGGRVGAREVLLSSQAVEKLILDGATAQVPIAIESGRRLGMRTQTDALVALVRDGVITAGEAGRHAPDRGTLVAALQHEGLDISELERRA